MQDFLKGGSNLGLHAKSGGGQGWVGGGGGCGPALGPMLKSLHRGTKGGPDH